MKFGCIVADPPWDHPLVGRFKNPRHSRPDALPYPTMSVDEICRLPVAKVAREGTHCWLWTTNALLRPSFDVLDAWGFRYLTCITWIKPSGLGAWFVSRTQHLLFGYRSRLKMKTRYQPNVLFANPLRHSAKPEAAFKLIEAVSTGPRLELFARLRRPGWSSWGNEIESDFDLAKAA